MNRNQKGYKAMVFLAVVMSFAALFASGCSFGSDGYEDVDGFTIARDWKLAKVEGLYYKFFNDTYGKPWLTLSFDQDTAILYYERSATARKLASSDVASLVSWADYESANGDSLSADGYGWVNFVFFPDKTKTTDFTTARVGSFENTANSSLAPYLERASARISTSSITMAQGEVLDIIPATTGAGLYAIPKPVAVGSTVVEPTTDTEWNGAPWVAVSGNKISLTLDFSGQSLLVLYCRERDPGKGWSKTVRLDITKSTTATTTTTTTTTVPQGTTFTYNMGISVAAGYPAGMRPYFIRAVGTTTWLYNGSTASTVSLVNGYYWSDVYDGTYSLSSRVNGQSVFRLSINSTLSPEDIGRFQVDPLENKYKRAMFYAYNGTVTYQ